MIMGDIYANNSIGTADPIGVVKTRDSKIQSLENDVFSSMQQAITKAVPKEQLEQVVPHNTPPLIGLEQALKELKEMEHGQ